MRLLLCLWFLFGSWLNLSAYACQLSSSAQLPDTEPLEMHGDIAATMVDGIDRFLLRELDRSAEQRERYWKRDFGSAEAYAKSIEPNRTRLAHMLGVRDSRHPQSSPTVMANAPQSNGNRDSNGVVAVHERFQVYAIRWPVVRDIHSEGLLLLPNTDKVRGYVVYVPDADQTPEQACRQEQPLWSVDPGQLAENGYNVIIPTLISRRMVQRHGRAKLTQREFLYRPSFELGRHILGYEIQKVLACVDWMESQRKGDEPIQVCGYGEGGLIALLAGAIDTRIDDVQVAGAFGSLQSTWKEGIDRNVFGLLGEFGDAELAAMIAPRRLRIDMNPGPVRTLSGSGGGAPGSLSPDHVDPNEIDRTRRIVEPLYRSGRATRDSWPVVVASGTRLAKPVHAAWRPTEDANAVEDRLVHEIERDTQWLLRESPYVRAEFMKKLDTSSHDTFHESVEAYRTVFREQVIGAFEHPLGPFQARSRRKFANERFAGYEVVLNVWEDVIAYGILLIPKDLQPNEKRPVVVCQHGLEGRPTDVIEGDHPAYHDYAAKLCERGFVVFAPQNLYIGKDRFRTLQRKANPLGKTLFSIIVPQHQQIVNWLKMLPYVDAERIAFYGLSYGGKSAMRIPPLVKDYCLAICSADFNEWVTKNASTRAPFSYVWTNEYEIFEWDLGSTFNYSEMATLIAPRPFMVERGHTDSVATDEWVAHEYAKIFRLYSHRLKVPDRCQMEVFDGPHTIHGHGTFDFLHKHLRWPRR